LNLLKSLQADFGLSFLLITHDLSVVRYMSRIVSVMYLGRIVEAAANRALFTEPIHPYTNGLIASIPQFSTRRGGAPLLGDLPDPRKPPAGCRFHTRCPIGPLSRPERTICVTEDPQLTAQDRVHQAACHFAASSTADQDPSRGSTADART
jgi:peptide/nickel transport system ATP-binding protein